MFLAVTWPVHWLKLKWKFRIGGGKNVGCQITSVKRKLDADNFIFVSFKISAVIKYTYKCRTVKWLIREFGIDGCGMCMGNVHREKDR